LYWHLWLILKIYSPRNVYFEVDEYLNNKKCKYCYDDKIKGDETGRLFGKYGRNEMSAGFDGETCRNEATFKNYILKINIKMDIGVQ
jgi:hypothetical protein